MAWVAPIFMPAEQFNKWIGSNRVGPPIPRSLIAKRYRERNPDKVLDGNSRRHKIISEKRKIARERIKLEEIKWLENNKEIALCWYEARKLDRKYYFKKLFQERKDHKRKLHAYDPRKNLISGAKCRAKRIRVPFSISIKDIVIPEYCPVIGVRLEVFHKDNAPSLDRIVPALGYVSGNVVVMSRRANRIKNDSTKNELKSLIKYLESIEQDGK